MQAYTELIPPSAVTHAIALPFLTGNEKNLVTVKTSLLQVFRIQQSRASHGSLEDKDGVVGKDVRKRLVLVGEYPLSGTVTGLGAVKAQHSRSGGDVLLISVKDAKLSLVEWDPENHRISTISIHYYEGDNVIHEPFGPVLGECESMLTVDPNSRCAALKFGARQLAILPFRQSGDDLIMEGADDDADGMHTLGTSTLTRTQSGLQAQPKEEIQTPYKSSFVLPITALDPTLKHLVDLAFLHEYREPTFGILSAPVAPSASLAAARKDLLTYSAFSLDLEQRASTNLVSVGGLPSDLFRVIPLSLPVGGALLVGTNELVHVDQSGKTVAVAVNEFATLASALSMADQSALDLKLEGCEITPLDRKTGDMIVLLKEGGAAILSFRLLGRNIGGLILRRYDSTNEGQLPRVSPSCTVDLGHNAFFVGSEEGDSSLLSWSNSATTLSRKRSHAQMLDEEHAVNEDDGDDDDLDDDDLYATAPTNGSAKHAVTGPLTNGGGAPIYSLSVQDSLPSLAPINAIAFGRRDGKRQTEEALQMAASIGRSKASRFVTMARRIEPSVRREHIGLFKGIKDAWSLKTEDAGEPGELDVPDYDNIFFAFDGSRTRVYDIVKNGSEDGPFYNERTETEFEQDGETLTVDTIANGRRIVQCRNNEIRTYDSKDLALSQIIPMVDDETDAELSILHVSLAGPFISVLRDDGSLLVLQVDQQGDVEPLDLPEELAGRDQKWQSSCVYAGRLFNAQTEPMLVAFGKATGLQIYSLPALEQLYQSPSLSFLPAVLTAAEQERRRGGQREQISEVLLADLGLDDVTSPYLLVRCGEGGVDVAMYEPFFSASPSSGPWTADWSTLRFRKTCAESAPVPLGGVSSDVDVERDARPQAMRPITVGRYSAVVVPGPQAPSLILKAPFALPKVLRIGSAGSSFPAFVLLNRPNCARGFGMIRKISPASATHNGDSESADEGETSERQEQTVFEECQFDEGMDLSSGWCIRDQPLLAGAGGAGEVRHIVYHEHDRKGFWVVAACGDVSFDVAGKDDEDGDRPRPRVPQYTLHLVSATTHQIVHSLELPYLEVVTDLKAMDLEISESTHAIGARLVVSTGALRGEDTPARGVLYVFETLDVVPDPEMAESGVQLRSISREETKGIVTALHAWPGGFVGTAQGQKLMVRGLKEDGSCLPVAFLDAQAYTVSLRTLGNSGLWLAADAAKGIWLGGFTQEPYRLTVLSKSRTGLEVVAADFLPFDGGLFLCVVDGNLDLQILQYDPENPKSLSGTRLLHRSTFHLGHIVDRMQALPSAPSMQGASLGMNGHDNEQSAGSPQVFQVLTTSPTGAVGLITCLDEATYRRLASLQTHLSNVLEHAAGLNPRAFRSAGEEGSAGRGVVDGTMIKRIWELGSARRAEVLARAGGDTWTLQNDLEHLGGIGLSYI